MIILYIIIGYLLVTCIALFFDITTNILTMSKSDIERCETIRDFLDEVYPTVFIPIVNVSYCISSVVVFLFMLFYKLYYIIKLSGFTEKQNGKRKIQTAVSGR